MSDRKSTSSPDACSGDIYAGVPTRLPGMVCAPALLSNDPNDGPDGDSARATVSASSGRVRLADDRDSFAISITAVSNSLPGAVGRGLTVFGSLTSDISVMRGAQ